MDNTLFWFLLCGYMLLLVCGIILYAMIQTGFNYTKLAHKRIDIAWEYLDLMANHAAKDDDKREERQHATTDTAQR